MRTGSQPANFGAQAGNDGQHTKGGGLRSPNQRAGGMQQRAARQSGRDRDRQRGLREHLYASDWYGADQRCDVYGQLRVRQQRVRRTSDRLRRCKRVRNPTVNDEPRHMLRGARSNTERPAAMLLRRGEPEHGCLLRRRRGCPENGRRSELLHGCNGRKRVLHGSVSESAPARRTLPSERVRIDGRVRCRRVRRQLSLRRHQHDWRPLPLMRRFRSRGNSPRHARDAARV